MRSKPAVLQDIRRIDMVLPLSVGLHAVRLLEQATESGQGGVIYVAESQRRAEQVARALKGLSPDVEAQYLPPWDCMPYDGASPSCEVMGRRMSALNWMLKPSGGPRVLIASASSIIQRVPPREIWRDVSFALKKGQPFSQQALEAFLHRTGYVLDERVDEPGEAAMRGQVIDLFPASGSAPYRAEHDGASITAIRCYDPISQRTEVDIDAIMLEPASEIIFPEATGDDPAIKRYRGMEHRLPEFYPCLETVFDYWPDAALIVEANAEERLRLAWEQIADAYESTRKLRGERHDSAASGHPISPEKIFITDEEWQNYLNRFRLTVVQTASQEEAQESAVPHFASAAKPAQVLAGFIKRQSEAGRRIVLAAATQDNLKSLRRRVRSFGATPEIAKGWGDILEGRPGTWFSLQADLRGGFIDERDGVAVISAFDVLGSRADSEAVTDVGSSALMLTDNSFHIGDSVIHLEHGIGRLEGIETVALGEGDVEDVVRLGFAGDATLMIPAMEMEHVWRYGSSADTVSPDKLNGDAWLSRRKEIEAEIRDVALRLDDLGKARKKVKLAPIVPQGRDYERFIARFPFSETPDQLRATEDILDDLASGHPMDRLICGDVGFGKTEVALRAAAAVALSGQQVAIVAPTTVLARQHLRTFQRRFAGLGIEVAHLSRLVSPAEARAVKKGLAEGTIGIVIGTHALAGKGVTFKDLGLVVIDEEQRFGTAHKVKLRNMAAGGHILTLTATPIPRTLQSSLVGLQDLSIIATPPARRQPIRTFLTAFDPVTVRGALMREWRRNGQSFIVCPRVEDIEPMQKQLAELVPELELIVAHGQMPPAEMDEAMVRFADGEGDVLLATSIIESGLDVPRANTMLVWRPDRFGLAQLHQLRGRVGRGRIRGSVYLLTEPGQELPRATEKRLRTLEALDRLGAGFAISAQDLDLRGAGSLLGEEQAGHLKIVGTELYQHMLKRALRGESADDDWKPEFNIGLHGIIPEDYVNEPEVRINLYARIARLDASETIADLEAEIEDRFGPIPEPMQNLLKLASLKQLCRRLGISRIDAGPQAIALSFRPGVAKTLALDSLINASQDELRWSGDRLILAYSAEQAEARQSLIMGLLERIEP